MKMQQGKLVSLLQGSKEWHELRAKRFTASEAAAAMGLHKYMSRNDLLKQKATGLIPEVSEQQQRIFDKGHAAEADARPLAEEIIGEELFPVVLDDAEGGFLASMDGLTMMGDIGFEHKWLSADLAKQIDAGKLEEHYLIQMDQQFILSGAEQILFVGSDGTKDNFKHLWIERDESRFPALEAAWEQFASDLAAYQPPEKEAVTEGLAPDQLPSLRIQVTGAVTASNLTEFRDQALAVIRGISTELSTDTDFANAEKAVKWCKDVEDRLKAAKDHALSQTASIDELFQAIDNIADEARKTRLALDKKVKTRKDELRGEIQEGAVDQVREHYASINETLDSVALGVPVDFRASVGQAMKGKKTISSLRSAADDAVASAKIEANQQADKVRHNLKTLDALAWDKRFLFADLQHIATKDSDDFEALVKSRLHDHEMAEAARAAENPEPAPEAPARGPVADQERIPASPSKDSATITIKRSEYDQLVHNSKMYLALHEAGVDVWEGYGKAMAIMQEKAA